MGEAMTSVSLWTAQLLLDRLQRHFINPSDPLPGGAFLTEIESYSAPVRRVDALYVGFVGSRGHHINGFELKVKRSDWLNELANPEKAEWWFTHTHRWWLVVPDTDVAKETELPPGWGMMMPARRAKTRMEVIVQADVREPLIDWGLFFNVVKRIDTLRARGLSEERREREKLVAKSIADFRASAGAEIAAVTEDRRGKEAIETLTKLTKLTGLHFPGGKRGESDAIWARLEESAEALRAWCQGSVDVNRVRASAEALLRRAHKDLGRSLEAFDA